MSESQIPSLAAEARDALGRGAARANRRGGRTPAVLYGGAEPPQSLTLDAEVLWRTFRRGRFTARLLDLDIGGKKLRVLPREVQLHPVTDRLLHVDFLRLTKDSKVRVPVPVQFVDQEDSPGLKRGGVLNVVRHEIEMICTATAIPERIVVSLANLDIGDSVHIGSVKLPEGVKPVIARNFTVASVVAPLKEEVVAPTAAAAVPAEGEVPAEGAAAVPGATPGAAPAAGAAP
ncbi:MAG: 50S ribosomal protein L25/general stress protein Ctc, partial [Alphaproteobacteria bacterium]|nr:50S ribosomal protein L25/general stress protein Ctc [Alphaproteobacteria bacterium]